MRCRPTRSRPRSAFTARGLLLLLPVLLAIPITAFFMLREKDETTGPMLHKVELSEFVYEVTERGEVESASNVDIRSEVRSQGSQGVMILEIVDEGIYVEPGDVLVKLDSSALENQRTQQQIICNNSEAAVVQAQTSYESALIAQREYLEGTFTEQEQSLTSALFVAEENSRRAKDHVNYSQTLMDKGYITESQLVADQFAVEKAKKELESAQTKLRVLREFTKKKKEMELEANIATAKARWDAEKLSHDLDVEKRDLIETQIENCVITAPEAGQVVYANERNHWGGVQTVMEAGTVVRERQTIIRLPDPKRMQVEAKINETRVTAVTLGMPAIIRLDAFPDVELTGEVTKISDYAAPTSRFGANTKEYETLVSIDQELEGLRPGLTAEVEILIDRVPDVIHVPVQTVLEHGGKHYCGIHADGKTETRVVHLGPTNDKTVIIQSGLEVGDQIVMGIGTCRDELGLPELKEETGEGGKPTDEKASTPTDKTDRPTRPASGGKATPGGEGRRPERGSGAGRPDGGAGGGPTGGGGMSSPAKVFSMMDKDGNGKLDASEIPEQMKSRVASIDTDGDSQVSLAEMTAAFARMKAAGGGGGGSPGGGPGGHRGGGAGGGSGMGRGGPH